MKKLLLLGIWDTTPADSWQWMSLDMVKHFYRLTGFRIQCVTIRKDRLNHECLVYSDVNKLFRYFDALSLVRQQIFVRRILKDFTKQSKRMEIFINTLEKTRFAKLTNQQIADIMGRWQKVLPLTTMQIWFAILIDIMHPNPNELVDIKLKLGKARDRSGDIHDRAYQLAWKIYRVTARRFKIPYQDLLNAIPAELAALLGHVRAIPHLAVRSRLSVFAAVSNRQVVLSGPKAKRFIGRYDIIKQEISKQRELRGTPISPGFAKGKVRFVFYNQDFSKFKKGEILVAYQTMVHFLPVMKKAGAIVTQYGGLTSHAAIVARELKKPCIVGIRGVTKLLKTGDRVEVDATKGIVRKL